MRDDVNKHFTASYQDLDLSVCHLDCNTFIFVLSYSVRIQSDWCHVHTANQVAMLHYVKRNLRTAITLTKKRQKAVTDDHESQINRDHWCSEGGDHRLTVAFIVLWFNTIATEQLWPRRQWHDKHGRTVLYLYQSTWSGKKTHWNMCCHSSNVQVPVAAKQSTPDAAWKASNKHRATVSK